VVVRENIIIGSVIGLFFCAVGAIVAALAIKYAAASILWDFILGGGIALALASVATLAFYVSSQLTGRPFLMAALLVNIGICFIVGGIVWHYSAAGSEGKKSGAALFVEYAFASLPTTVPSEGRVDHLDLFYSPDWGDAANAPTGLGGRHGDPGQKWDWHGPTLKVSPNYRCQITNLTTEPMFFVEIVLRVYFKEVIRDLANMRSGDVIHSRDWPIMFNKIDAGKQVIFYASNQSRYFAYAAFPSTASYADASNKNRLQVEVSPVAWGGMSFNPAESTST